MIHGQRDEGNGVFDELPDEFVWLSNEDAAPPPDLIEILDVEPHEELPDIAWDLLVMAIGRSMLSSYSFAHFGGYVEPKILHGALRFYLQLQPDEHLLAVIDPTNGRNPMRGCAITTRRLYWPSPTPTTTREELFVASEGGQPPFQRSIGYETLDEVGPDGRLSASGETIGTLKFSWRHRRVRAAVIEILNTMIQATQNKDKRPRLSLREEERARRDLRAVTRRTNECLETQGTLKKLPAILKVVVPRIHAVPLLMLLNIGYYLFMVLSGVSPLMKDPVIGRSWGANYGPSTVIDGEWWRLFSSMFLHWGWLHLAGNMFTLLWLGRLVERLFGTRGFLALYLLSGVAGSMASVWSHPLVTSAGASGAVFGMAGGLFGYLVVRRDIAPHSLLQIFSPTLVIYMTFDALLSLILPGVDAAAHLGGFGGGFLAGMLLNRPWPPPLVPKGVIRRLIGTLVMTAGLAALFLWLRPTIVTKMNGDPEVAKLRDEANKAVQDYDRFLTTIDPMLIEYRAIEEDFRSFVDEDQDRELQKFLPVERITKLKKRAQANRDRIASIQPDDPDFKLARIDLLAAQVDYIKAVESIEHYLLSGDEFDLQGPDGAGSRLEQASNQCKAFNNRLKSYLKTHELDVIESENDKGAGD